MFSDLATKKPSPSGKVAERQRGRIRLYAVTISLNARTKRRLLPHLIRHGSAVTPSPKGKTFFALYCPYYHI